LFLLDYTYLDVGERDLEKPLPWTQIESTEYTPWSLYENYDLSIENSRKRVFDNPQFQLIDAHAKWLKERQQDQLVYLNYEAFKKDIEASNQEAEAFDILDEFTSTLSFSSPEYELAAIVSDSIFAKKREIWHKDLTGDVYVAEAVNVLKELKVKSKLELVKN